MKVKSHKEPVIINHRSAFVYGEDVDLDAWIEKADGSAQYWISYPTHTKRTDGSLAPIKWDSTNRLMECLQPTLRHWRQVYGGQWRLIICPHVRTTDRLRPDEDRPENLKDLRMAAEERILESEYDSPGTRFLMARKRMGRDPDLLKSVPPAFRPAPKNPASLFEEPQPESAEDFRAWSSRQARIERLTGAMNRLRQARQEDRLSENRSVTPPKGQINAPGADLDDSEIPF